MPASRRYKPGSGGTTWTCEVCGKRAYSSWQRAHWDADQQRRRYRERRRDHAYWSRRCHCFHVGSLHPRPSRKDPSP